MDGDISIPSNKDSFNNSK